MRFTVRAATITRPADVTAYATGDLLANSTTAGSVTPFIFASGSPRNMLASRFFMVSSNDTVTNKNYQLYLFGRSPTVSNGDNGAFAVTKANGMDSICAVFGSSAAVNSGGGSINTFLPIDGAGTFLTSGSVVLLPGTFYGLIKVNAAYTPTSAETFDLWVEAEYEIG